MDCGSKREKVTYGEQARALGKLYYGITKLLTMSYVIHKAWMGETEKFTEYQAKRLNAKRPTATVRLTDG